MRAVLPEPFVLLKNICGMWLLERCRCDWEEISYPELIAEAEASEPFRSLINPDDALFANPMNVEQAIRTIVLTIISRYRRPEGKWYGVSSKVWHCAIVRCWRNLRGLFSPSR